MHNTRLDKLRGKIALKGLDSLLVTDPANIFYLSGLYLTDFGEFCTALLVTGSESHVLVDPRYTLQASDQCLLAEVHEYRGKPLTAAAVELVGEVGAKLIGFEADHITVSAHRDLKKRLAGSARLRATRGVVQKLRLIKDSEEMKLVRTAAAIADAAFDAVMLEVKPGMTEKEVALLVDVSLRRMGADAEAFPTIAAAGPSSALPHAMPGDAVIKQNGILLMDFGARYRGYCSDITRTVFLGKPTKKQKEIYQIVLDAQRLAIDAIAPGKSGREIDSIARDYIASHGHADHFAHGLGHGIGITVHDHPALSQTSTLILKPGMVLTVEPGIYIKGWGGVRIEDDVLVTERGPEVLTGAAK